MCPRCIADTAQQPSLFESAPAGKPLEKGKIYMGVGHINAIESIFGNQPLLTIRERQGSSSGPLCLLGGSPGLEDLMYAIALLGFLQVSQKAVCIFPEPASAAWQPSPHRRQPIVRDE